MQQGRKGTPMAASSCIVLHLGCCQQRACSAAWLAAAISEQLRQRQHREKPAEDEQPLQQVISGVDQLARVLPE